MSVKIIENYASIEDCNEYISFLDQHGTPSPRVGIINALGYPSSYIASRTNGETGAIHGDENPTNKKLGALFEKIKISAQEFFGCELDLCQSNYQNLIIGGSNPLHADSTKLDGSPIQEDGSPEEIEWSGLLYLNNYGDDFDGGVLTFPGLDITYFPKAGDLVLFRGDVEHRHAVSEVTSGERKNIVFFWANKGNISDTSFFDVEYKN